MVRKLTSPTQVQAILQVFFFGFPNTGKGPPGNPGTFYDPDCKKGGISFRAQMVDFKGHIFEIPL